MIFRSYITKKPSKICFCFGFCFDVELCSLLRRSHWNGNHWDSYKMLFRYSAYKFFISVRAHLHSLSSFGINSLSHHIVRKCCVEQKKTNRSWLFPAIMFIEWLKKCDLGRRMNGSTLNYRHLDSFKSHDSGS